MFFEVKKHVFNFCFYVIFFNFQINVFNIYGSRKGATNFHSAAQSAPRRTT